MHGQRVPLRVRGTLAAGSKVAVALQAQFEHGRSTFPCSLKRFYERFTWAEKSLHRGAKLLIEDCALSFWDSFSVVLTWTVVSFV